MKNLLFFFCILFFHIGFAQESGAYKTEDRNLPPFQFLKVFGNIEIELNECLPNEEKVHIKTLDLETSSVETKVENGELKIRLLKDFFSKGRVKIILFMADIQEIKLSAGARVFFDEALRTSSFKLDLNSGSEARLEVICKNLILTISEGSKIHISGKAETLELAAFTKSTVESFGFVCRKASVKSNTNSKVLINCLDELEMKATLGGKIIYRGSPKVSTEAANTGGEITRFK